MHIGNLSIAAKAALAPMAGVADAAFRRVCVEHGAGYVVGEMVSAKGLCQGDPKSRALLRVHTWERPAAVQLFGNKPAVMAEAARSVIEEARGGAGAEADTAADRGYDAGPGDAVPPAACVPAAIDINMGCPVPKIVSGGAGSALMRSPALCEQIVRAVRCTLDAAGAKEVPVTVKIRKGYSPREVNAVEVARACEAGGAAAVAVHGRTRDQMYAPPVDWDCIAAVKRAVGIPVIGNGDVDSAAAAAALYERSGCDLVMAGRGALGRPWLFAEIEAWLTHGVMLPPPPLSKRLAVLLRQAEYAIEDKGERVALLEMRKHAGWYMRGLPGAAALRARASGLCTWDDLRALCDETMRADTGAR
ncbi:MAG: tRNA-dihydrouridine synthase [Oscillospiraceae bacterium]|nr:tRNA-dihydrouridine synthase [Oscillospiraceae bacterium]